MKQSIRKNNLQDGRSVESVCSTVVMKKFEEFEKQHNRCKEQEAKKRKQTDLVGNLRLLTFIAGAAATIFLFIRSELLLGVLCLFVFLTAFIFLVVRHKRLLNEMERLSCKAQVNRMYMDRMRAGWMEFDDSGMEFISKDNPFTGDLDIFGPSSLFQWISVAKTHYGRIKLSELLEEPDKSIKAIKQRQGAVKELCGKLDFCRDLQSEGMLARGVSHDPEKLLAYAEDQTARFKNKWIINLFYILPGAFLVTIVLWLIGAPVPLFVPLLLLTVQMIIFAAGFIKNTQIVNMVYGMKKHLGAYGSLLQLIEQQQFKDEYLSGLKQELYSEKGSASESLKKLESIANAVDMKYSTVLHFILNAALLWDYHCVFALEEWKELYGGHIRDWLVTVGRMEALSSLAVIGHMYPQWTYPTFTQTGLRFGAIGLGHPLIPKDSCVCNDFKIERGSCVITGSNMSGKTTLLRTVGINLVLAYAGAPVFAQKLECAVMDIFTSMRVHDDLGSGISTFYAELLRIKMIIDHSRKKLPMIYLIDEIFMGTNSADRIIGARSVLKNLSRSWIIGMISTHDFELCDLEQENNVNVENYHFVETYVKNEIRFDYKLRPGRSRTTNAKYLMKMVGIELED